MGNRKALAIIGPTATGKTQLTLELAKTYPIEIISLDSALIYQDMNIGTAKPTQEELDAVPHHLIDIITPVENYDVAHFVADCTRLIAEINRRNKIALIVGGTMMYYHALLNGLNALPTSDSAVRQKIQNKKESIGLIGLYQELKTIDPVSASRIKSNDSQRIERALEVFYLSGLPMSDYFSQSQHGQKQQITTITLIPNHREDLRQTIKTRLLQMFENGFINEVLSLREKYPSLTLKYPAMRCVGYRQIWEYLEGHYCKDEMFQKALFATRQLAKRQITWLRNKLELELVIDPYHVTSADMSEIHLLLEQFSNGM